MSQQVNPQELCKLHAELAALREASRRSTQERGRLQAIVTLACLLLFALGLKFDSSSEGRRYSWNLDSVVVVQILSLLTGGSAIATGLAAYKNISSTSGGGGKEGRLEEMMEKVEGGDRNDENGQK
jgi:hypothetical protein